MEPTFDITIFRQQFPEFADPTLFPDAVLNQYYAWATCYINPQVYPTMALACLTLALNLMVAHLTKQSIIIAQNQVPEIVNTATIDKVNVGFQQIPSPNQWRYWLSTTAYGGQLLALLQALSVGGYYIGGAPETSAFRRVGGFY